MFLSKLSIERPVMVTMGILVFVVFGIMGYIGMPLNLMPDVKLPFISIQTIYPGAGPREIETQITKKIEDAVSTVSQIDYMQSYSMESASIVVIAFELGKNVDIANQEVKDKVDSILREFPTNSEKPVVQKFDFGASPFMDIVLSGNMDGKELYELADNKLKDRLSQIPGVAQVTLTGGSKRQIDVRFDDRVIYENQLSLAQLTQIMAAQNMDMPAGNFTRGSQDYSVRLKGEYQNLEEVMNADIPTKFGVKKLRQLATVTDSSEEVRSRAVYYNVPNKQLEENIIRVSITKSSDGNVVNIAKDVQKRLPVLQKEMPEGVQLEVIRDDSTFIRDTVSDTLGNILMGILLTGLILFLFLHDLRSTLIVALSMPISIISTFVLLRMAGFTLNIMTLMGLSTAVGILVTNSVVVLENIFRHKDMGNSRRDAAEIGTAEITVAVMASTLTNIVVFLPIASMTSMIGQFFKEFALTVTFATIFSLISAFTITPMLASRIIPEGKHDSRFGLKFDAWFAKFSRGYAKFLAYVLQSRKRSLSIILLTVLALIGSFALFPFVGMEIFPIMDQGYLSIKVELPQGYNLEQTAKILTEIQNRVSKHKEIKHIVTNLGTQGMIDTGTNLAAADVQMIDPKLRKISSTEMADILTHDLADIPNARIKVSASQGMGGGDAPVTFFLQGQDNDRLESIKNEVFKQIHPTPGLLNLDTSTRSGSSELTLYPNRTKMAEIGATVYDLALALRASVEGMVSTQYRESGNQYDIKLSLNDDAVDSPDKIMNLSISVYGQSYLLSQLADVAFAPGINKITHRDRYKSVQFSADVAKGANLGDVVAGVKERIAKINLPSGYRVVWGGDAEMLASTVTDMLRTFILAVLLTYMLLAAILESFAQPLLIMATVPLALIGVVLALLLSGQALNILSMMAVIMLVGIVVNNAILILDYTNIKRKDGFSAHDSLLEAGEMKLKPIVMSTLSIVIGMLPMAIGIGSSGKEFRQSMGIVSIGGLIVSTFLTLIIIPAFYYLTTHNLHSTKTQE
jgi:HAE1 family hydrophobic/amphiphilic exporter-1